MKYGISLCGFILVSFVVAGAQVASHAPTAFKQPPPQPTAQASNTVPMITLGRPVARVNGSVLTDADLVREEYAIFPYAKQHNGLPKDLAPQIRDGAMKMIIFEELVYQDAMQRKMTVSPNKMLRAEAQFKKQFATPDEYAAFLQSDFHGSEQLFQAKVRRSLLIEALLKIEVASKAAVSPAELRAFYDKNPARFEHPETYTFQTISVLPPANPTPDQLKEGRSRADKALVQAKATKTVEEFGLLAEKISDDDYRVMMGQHKPVPADKLSPEVVKALLSMKVGDVSGLIQIEQAFTIVHLQQHTPAGKDKFEVVKAQLQKELEKSKNNQVRADLDKKLRQSAKIEEL